MPELTDEDNLVKYDAFRVHVTKFGSNRNGQFIGESLLKCGFILALVAGKDATPNEVIATDLATDDKVNAVVLREVLNDIKSRVPKAQIILEGYECTASFSIEE